MVEFTCPACGKHRLEEVMVGVTVASIIIAIPDCGDLNYGEQTNENGTVDRYQCVDCGFVIPACDDPRELARRLYVGT